MFLENWLHLFGGHRPPACTFSRFPGKGSVELSRRRLDGPQGPKLPFGPLQKNLLSPGAGTPGSAKATLDRTSMAGSGCDGERFIYRNTWQPDSACGLWFADLDLEHQLHRAEAQRLPTVHSHPLRSCSMEPFAQSGVPKRLAGRHWLALGPRHFKWNQEQHSRGRDRALEQISRLWRWSPPTSLRTPSSS